MFSPKKIIKTYEDNGHSVAETELFLKNAFIRDLHENGIPVKHFDNNGVVSYVFRNDTYIFDIGSLHVLDILNYPLGTRTYNPILPVMQIHNLAEKYILIPCIKNGKPGIFKAQHKAATDLCEIWYRLHFDYVDKLNALTEYILDYDFKLGTPEEEEASDLFGLSLYGNILYNEPLRIKF